MKKDRNYNEQKKERLRRGGKTIPKNYTKKVSVTWINQDGVYSPRARYPGLRSQVGLRKHH